MADAAPVVLEELTAGTANEKLDHLASQVEDIHVQVCEALHRKYNSVLSCDDTTGGLTDHVITQFANLKPAFEQLGKVKSPSRLYSILSSSSQSVVCAMAHTTVWLLEGDIKSVRR